MRSRTGKLNNFPTYFEGSRIYIAPFIAVDNSVPSATANHKDSFNNMNTYSVSFYERACYFHANIRSSTSCWIYEMKRNFDSRSKFFVKTYFITLSPT